jgi:ABC-type glycerol-3-phosphate transport system permease component
MQNPQMAWLPGMLASVLATPAGMPNEMAVDWLWTINVLAVTSGTFFLLLRMMGSEFRDRADAARIDGFGFLGTWWHVTLPVMRPVLWVIGVLVLVGACDDALAPVIETGGVVSPGLYALHNSAGGFAMGAGVQGLAMGGVLFLIATIMTMLCGGGGRAGKRVGGAK